MEQESCTRKHLSCRASTKQRGNTTEGQHMKKHLVWLCALPLLGACDLEWDDLGGCSHQRDLSDAISATGMATLRVLAEDGHLRIEGRPGLNQVRVFATACSSSSRTVGDIDFQLYRNGTTVELESDVPLRDNAHLDIVVEMPEEMAAAIYHDAGDIEVFAIDYVYIDDESGNIDIRDIFFDVEIVDGSGHIDIFNVDGSVEIDDGSGDIDVEDIGGDFSVYFDSSGSIRHRNVRGRILLP